MGREVFDVDVEASRHVKFGNNSMSKMAEVVETKSAILPEISIDRVPNRQVLAGRSYAMLAEVYSRPTALLTFVVSIVTRVPPSQPRRRTVMNCVRAVIDDRREREPDRVVAVTISREIIVVGSGGHGREVACVAISAGKLLRGFVDDSPPRSELLAPFGVGYLGAVAEWEAVSAVDIVVGIGSGAVREAVARRLAASGIGGGLVDPRSSVGIDVRLSEGVVVFAQASVTTNIDLGRHTHIGRGAAVGHDCVLGDFVTVMPLASVSGNVTIGDRVTVGAGAVIRQGQSIGADAFVGAGAVVVSDVPPGVTVVGNPARPIGRMTINP